MLLWGKKQFSPVQIPSLQAWYDFSDSNYLTLVSTAITQALDRSGNGSHTAVQGTATARPTFTTGSQNGLPVAVFDGGDTLALPSALYAITNGNSTIFTVAKRTTETASQECVLVFSQTGVTRTNQLTFSGTSGSVLYRNNTVANDVTATGNTNTNYSILYGRHSGTTQAISVNNGTEVTNTNATNASTTDMATIGASQGTALYLTGGIAEILVYNRALTAAEIVQVNRYLSNKWGITIS